MVELIKTSKKIRIAGTAHSFTPLLETGETLLNLDNWQGITQVNPDNKTATVKAGTKLNTLGQKLYENDLAMENLGDIDKQSLAGSLNTGTHGTGIQFGTLSTQIQELKILDANGNEHTCSETQNRDLFKAAQISLGALGLITEYTLNLVPAYKLKYTSSATKLEEVYQNLDVYNQKNRNFEIYWFPYTQTVQLKISNETEEPLKGNGIMAWFNDLVMENWLFKLINDISRYIPGTHKTVSRFTAWGVPKGTKISHSHKVYATIRLVRFQEMEYNIPREAFIDCMREITETIHKENFRVSFPLECRFVKADDIWLSPAYQRESAYIAVHQYKGMAYKEYFQAIEEIFHKYEGRPHWGKMHTCTTEYLKKQYPKWDAYQQIRNQYDPEGKFLNPYLEKLFQPAPVAAQS